MSNANNRAAARNGEDCAYPCDGPNVAAYGLTKREYFAAMAMQGLLANPTVDLHAEDLGKYCVANADKLLQELAK